ncbi:oligopeptide transport system substrate-binding protein [Ligilactobacillus sp. WC1T17]|uniref:Oligopeptide transport system substrate-binding protein n=1 Tax=Ligilactobacillus ruminis TaxID=1623 RepID=A0ABY1AC30_9LACO|nr:oligopeptide transport system substrate-binding protein [Ligilactobacillus ruminis]
MGKKLLALTVAGSALLLAACGNKQTTQTTTKQVLSTAVMAEMATLDPSDYSDTTSLEAMQNTYEGLYRFNQKISRF